MMASFHCCGTSPALPIQTTISSSLQRRGGPPSRVILNSSMATPSGPTAFPFANERLSGMFTGHWSRPSAMFGSSSGDLAFRSVESPYPSFADELNVPQEYAVLVFDVRRAAASLPLQIRRL